MLGASERRRCAQPTFEGWGAVFHLLEFFCVRDLSSLPFIYSTFMYIYFILWVVNQLLPYFMCCHTCPSFGHGPSFVRLLCLHGIVLFLQTPPVLVPPGAPRSPPVFSDGPRTSQSSQQPWGPFPEEGRIKC